MNIFGAMCQSLIYLAIPTVVNVTSIFDSPEWDENVVNLLS